MVPSARGEDGRSCNVNCQQSGARKEFKENGSELHKYLVGICIAVTVGMGAGKQVAFKADATRGPLSPQTPARSIADPRRAKMATKVPIPMGGAAAPSGPAFGDTWVDYVCPAAVAISFFAAVPWGRKVYWIVDATACLVFGVGLLLIPQTILGFQVAGGKLDDVHLLLARMIGAYLVGQAATWIQLRHSIDGRLIGSLVLAKVIGSALLLIALLYSAHNLWKRPFHFNEKFLSFSCLGVASQVLGGLVELWRTRDLGGYDFRPSYLASGLILDHVALLLAGVVCFAFPSPYLKAIIKPSVTIDGVHVCLLRVAASFCLGAASVASASPGFLYPRDQRAHVIGRLITQTLCFGVALYGRFGLDCFTMNHVTPFMCAGFYITFLLSLFFKFPKEKTTKKKESKKDKDN